MPEELRPSNCKVVFEIFKPEIIFALVDPTRPDAWRQKEVMKVIRTLAATGKAVIVTDNKKAPVFFLPASHKADDVVKEIREELVARTERLPGFKVGEWNFQNP